MKSLHFALPRILQVLLASIAITGAFPAVFASVHLTSYDFSPNQPPQIFYQNESMPSQYRLRAKFPGDRHCAQGWQNNGETLSNLPPPGTYYVELYWVKYDGFGNITQIQSPYNGYWVTIRSNTAPTTHSAWASPNPANQNQGVTFYGHATDPNNNLLFIHFYVWRPGGSAWEYVGSHHSPGGTGGNVVGWMNWTPSQSGTHWIHIRAVDNAGVWDTNANVVGQFHVRAPQGAVWTQDKTLTAGASFTPDYFQDPPGSSGAWQFVVSSHTNWPGTNGYGTGQSGTMLPNNTVVGSWTPPGPGTYSFWVRHLGDSNYMDSNISDMRTLTVIASSYSLSVLNGTGSGTYNLGAAASITATPPAGCSFTSWSLVSGPGSFANPNASSTTFTMGAGNATVQAHYADVQAPTIPAGLNASNLQSSSFTLNWSASSDNLGVTAYEVLRSGTSLGTTSALSMPVTGLTANTTYQMQVRARDAAGNWSAWSSSLPVTPGGGVQPDNINLNIHLPTL